MIKFICKLCDEVFDSEEELYEHLRQYHKVVGIENYMIRYELEEWVRRGLEEVFDADVNVRGVYRGYAELEVGVSAYNVSFFWKKVADVMNRLVELGWYPEYVGGDYDNYLMEWHAVVFVSLDKVRDVLDGFDKNLAYLM